MFKAEFEKMVEVTFRKSFSEEFRVVQVKPE
jgi:hypothetical protein